jgi:multimeric flavodoxin WrbA
MLPGVQTTPRKSLLIVYHSMTGGSLQMAQAACRGASGVAELDVCLLAAQQAGADDVLAADGYLFVTPENLAAMSGVMKDFFDRTYYRALERINARPYALMVCAGSDGGNAARQLERIATGWRLNKVAEALIVCTHAQTPEDILAAKTIAPDQLQLCEELGQALGNGLVMGIF